MPEFMVSQTNWQSECARLTEMTHDKKALQYHFLYQKPEGKLFLSAPKWGYCLRKTII